MSTKRSASATQEMTKETLEENVSWKKNFFLIFSGQAFSLIGSSAVQFAIIWWLTERTDSAITLTLATLLGLLPEALLGPFAGALVDRHSKKWMMILADGFVALCSAVIFIFLFFATPPVWLVYLILFLRSVGNTFHSPALQAAFPLFTPEDKLIKASGWRQLVISVGKMIGPVLGAAFIALFGMQGIMMVDIVGALIAIVTLFFVSFPREQVILKEKNGEKKPSLLQEIIDGYRLVIQNKPLVRISLCVLGAVVLYMPMTSLLPLIVLSQFDGNAWQNSIAQALFAAGLLLTSAALGIWGKMRKRFALITLSIALLGVCITLSSLIPANMFYVFALLAFATGSIGTLFVVPYNAYVQMSVPEHALGKVNALLISISSLTAPLGLLIAGPVPDTIGVSQWFFYSGIALAIIGAIGYLITRKDEQTVF
ncbi:MAG: MFS transporter [Christensenellaceae bacterium]|jgi:DHA3 family macrolide efflux protein-like MFS transporter